MCEVLSVAVHWNSNLHRNIRLWCCCCVYALLFPLTLHTLHSIFLSTFLQTSLIMKKIREEKKRFASVVFFLVPYASIYGLFCLKWAVDLTSVGKIVIILLAFFRLESHSFFHSSLSFSHYIWLGLRSLLVFFYHSLELVFFIAIVAGYVPYCTFMRLAHSVMLK